MNGTIFSVALNHKSQIKAWSSAFHQPPYQAPPKTPIWFIKTRNTVIGHLAPIIYPQNENVVLSGATLGLVVGKTTRRITANQAQEFIQGYILANEISLPETHFYRPAIKAKCRDSFCPLGSEIRDIDIRNQTITTKINGSIIQQWHTEDLVYSPYELLSALSEFVTLQTGDVILLGTPHQRVEINVGDRVTVNVDGFMPLENIVIRQGATS